MSIKKVGIFGASGRMGRSVVHLIATEFAGEASVAARVSGRDGTLDNFGAADAIIDFSLPAGTDQLIDWLEARSGSLPILVSGTTGLDDDQRDRLRALGTKTRVLYASNFSPGVAAVTAILEFAAPVLKRLAYRPVLTEVHHEQKKDAPSGTARTLCRVIDPGHSSSTEIHSIRAGGVIGRHDVAFYGPSEQIVVAHEAVNRDVFARGAIEAALWMCDQSEVSGYYTMEEYFARRYLA